ncbi:unnamed protein product [Callosobruchus maculatus]|uniref:Uncharacterized protein n=1 Tax=Callosobruchus maculatus TaxID=64391 RepID=A0A653DL85_CALMS|nr:unnamed protein product [Callosobruchus maculatus]
MRVLQTRAARQRPERPHAGGARDGRPLRSLFHLVAMPRIRATAGRSVRQPVQEQEGGPGAGRAAGAAQGGQEGQEETFRPGQDVRERVGPVPGHPRDDVDAEHQQRGPRFLLQLLLLL